MRDGMRRGDTVDATMASQRSARDTIGLRGYVTAELRGPDGELRGYCTTRNLITQVGDEYYGNRASGAGTQPAQVTGMKLGTGSTAPAKTGAGASLGASYLTDSDQAIEAGFPTSSLNVGARRISWRAIWAAGKATTGSPITECVIVNDVLADATTPEANTIARALLTGIGSKGVDDTLTVNWHHDAEGA